MDPFNVSVTLRELPHLSGGELGPDELGRGPLLLRGFVVRPQPAEPGVVSAASDDVIADTDVTIAFAFVRGSAHNNL